MNDRQANSLARAWIEAWNRHDLDAIVHHYATDVEFTSPFVPALSGEPSGTIHGRESLTGYFRKGLHAYPDLRFELIAEGFNVTNASNPTSYVGSQASSSFGKPNRYAGDFQAGEQRMFQLGVRLDF